MFQFRAFPPYTYLIQCTVPEYCSGVLPHSEISGSMLICSSPKLIAACHVLHRLLMPRHSPCALYSLTYVEENCVPFRSPFRRAPNLHFTPFPSPFRAEPACAGLRLGRSNVFVSLEFLVLYQELCRLNRIVKTKLYLPLLKVPQLKFLLRLSSRLSVALLILFLSSVQFSRCN